MNSLAKLFIKPYRYRFPLIVIKLSILLCIFVSSRDVKAIIYWLFRAKVTHKTICEWNKKFPLKLPDTKVTYRPDETVILFADEKYVWIKDVQAYWWSVRDHTGRVLASIITMSRDSESAKQIFRRARAKICGKVHAVVHDGLKSYKKPVKWTFGRNCQSIVAGICGKAAFINGKYFWLTNNTAESLNTQIDAYYTRLHYNFNNLESANKLVDMFLCRMHLRDVSS